MMIKDETMEAKIHQFQQFKGLRHRKYCLLYGGNFVSYLFLQYIFPNRINLIFKSLR
jgi:hypothetical protein